MKRIISVVSGKGGVGKTVTAMNLATALNQMGNDVLLVDGNLSTPSIHIYFGAKDLEHSLIDVIKGKMHFSDVIHLHASGLRILPSLTSVNDLKIVDYGSFKDILHDLKSFADLTIVDVAAGLNDESISVLEASDEILVVTNPEEASVDIARNVIAVAKELRKPILGVVVNKSQGTRHELTDAEISTVLDYPVLLRIPFDKNMKFSHLLKHPLVFSHPNSKASKSFRYLAEMLVDTYRNL